MASLKNNIIANFLGQGWTGLLALVFIPAYIEYLGIEAYGLITLFIVIQSILMLLDVGMTPTINREMAKFNAGFHTPQSIRELLRSIELICCVLAALIIFIFWITSTSFANDWLKIEHLSTNVVKNSLVMMALVVGMRLFEGVYRGSLYGLEQQVWYNAVYSIVTLLRYGGALVIMIWISASVEVFFIWQAIISFITVFLFCSKIHQILPKVIFPIRFSFLALVQVRKFATGMIGITFLTMAVLQLDKVLLSRLLHLNEFGYYALASTAASVLYMVIVPVTQAIYPTFVSSASNNSYTRLIVIYHQMSQLVIVLISPAAMLLCFYAGGVLYVWSGNTNLVHNTAYVLSILAAGSFLNCLSYLPYQLQIANGWTSQLFKIILFILVTLVFLIYIFVPLYGAEGSAWIWLIINTAYLVLSTHFTHKKILTNEKWRWYFYDLFLPTLGVIVVMALAKFVQPPAYQSRLEWLFFIIVTMFFATLTSSMLLKTIRMRILKLLKLLSKK
jgi:O-antigen/teichoic acid export membrane protein